jgi:hypothetical protein
MVVSLRVLEGEHDRDDGDQQGEDEGNVHDGDRMGEAAK